MTLSISNKVEKEIRCQENWLFFKRWLKHPFQLGTLAPISVKLANFTASFIQNVEGYYVEIGAGTGRLSRALLHKNIDPEKLALVELDPFFCGFLRSSLSKFLLNKKSPHIIEGDATHLRKLLPKDFIGKVDTVFSVIPLMYLSPSMRMALMEAAFQILKPGGSVIHITYSPFSPLNFTDHISQHCKGKLWLNFPSGFVWHYQKTTI